MSSIEHGTTQYHKALSAAVERSETMARKAQERCDQVIAAAEKMIAAARAEAEGVQASAVDAGERAIADATRQLDQVLAAAVGAPPNAAIRDRGGAMELWLGAERLGEAGPASGSYLVTVAGLTECVGSWSAARLGLWRGATKVEAERRPLLTGVPA